MKFVKWGKTFISDNYSGKISKFISLTLCVGILSSCPENVGALASLLSQGNHVFRDKPSGEEAQNNGVEACVVVNYIYQTSPTNKSTGDTDLLYKYSPSSSRWVFLGERPIASYCGYNEKWPE